MPSSFLLISLNFVRFVIDILKSGFPTMSREYASPPISLIFEIIFLPMKVNVNGTYNILDFARKHGVNKVVLASSSAIYGDSREIAVESKYPDRYLNLYPVTKIIDELFSPTLLT